MSIEKNIFQWIPKTNESTHFVRKFLYLGFIVSVLQYLDSYYNEYPLEQTATLYLQLPLRLLVYFVSFGKISLCLFLCLLVFAYFWISGRNSSMEGGEGSIFSKPPNLKPLILVKTKN